MKSIRKIIKEEFLVILKENDEYIHTMYEAQDGIKSEMFQDFLYNNNQDFSKNIGWRVVPFPRLKKIWEDYMRVGIVRDEKGINMIESIMIRNALKIDIITALAGHTTHGDEEAIEENIGYWVDEQLNCILNKPFDKNQLEIPYDNPETGHKTPENNSECTTTIHPFAQEYVNDKFNSANMDREDIRGMLYDEMKDKLYEDYLTDPDSGHLYISDYGLPAIMTLTAQLYAEQQAEKKLILLDRMLNVVHQRSDLASWFIQGGSGALSDLSGYEVPDKDEGGYDTKSAISGRYKMRDYA